MISDGFNSANSIGKIPGNVLFCEGAYGGVTAKVYLQECKEMADQGQHGWYHVGIDMIETATGKVLDSIPVNRAAPDGTDDHGHYTREMAEAVGNLSVDEYKQAYDNAVAADAAFGREFDSKAWIDTIAEMAGFRRAEGRLMNLLAALFEGFIGDDEDDAIGTLPGKQFPVTRPKANFEGLVASILGDFDPDKVEPTDEGLNDDELDQTDTSK